VACATGPKSGRRRGGAQSRLAIAFAKGGAAEYGRLQPPFDPGGKINAAATERGLKLNASFAASLERSGEPFRRINEDKFPKPKEPTTATPAK